MLYSLLATYGYLFVFIGTFLEGEIVLAIAGFVAHNHSISLFFVIFWGFVGSFLGDQFFYWLGRYRGREYLEKRKHWQENADKVHGWLHKHKYIVMSGFRFIYGFRIVTPLVIGTSPSIRPLEFTLFNAVGALVWSTTIATLGYIFGTTLQLFIVHIKRFEREAIIFLVLVFATLWVWSYFKKKMFYSKKQGIIKANDKADNSI